MMTNYFQSGDQTHTFVLKISLIFGYLLTNLIISYVLSDDDKYLTMSAHDNQYINTLSSDLSKLITNDNIITITI